MAPSRVGLLREVALGLRVPVEVIPVRPLEKPPLVRRLAGGPRLRVVLLSRMEKVEEEYPIPLMVIAWLGLGACVSAAAALPSSWGLSHPERMERFIERRVHEVGVPGAAWVAVQEGSVAYSGATGLASLRSQTALTPHTPMELGSISKPFTAVAVMQLVDAGTIQLDAPVVRYLPEFELADVDAARQITVRQLLSHTSGIGTLAGNLTQADLDTSPGALQARVHALSEVWPSAASGERWQYSNSNYQVLGALIEEISGMDYGRYVEANVLRPLGMEDSYVFDPPENARPALGHRFWFGQLRPATGRYKGRGSAPQGGLVVSARDLGSFLAAMTNREDDILSAEGKAEMMREQPGAKNYGLGWHIRDIEDRRLVWHSGASPGFEAAAAVDPERQAGFALITNAHSGFAFGNINPLVSGALSEAFGMNPVEVGPRPIRIAVVAAVIAVPLLAVGYLVFLLRKRRRGGLKRPSGSAQLLGRILIPLLLLLAAAYALVVMVPQAFNVPLSAAWLYNPDVAALLTLAAAALVLTGLVRTWTLMTAESSSRAAGKGR